MTTTETVTETITTMEIEVDLTFSDDVIVAEGTVFDTTPVTMTDGLRARIVAQTKAQAIEALREEVDGEPICTMHSDDSPSNVSCLVAYGIGHQKQFIASTELNLWGIVSDWAMNG